MKIILKILITVAALFVAEALIAGIEVESFYIALIVALILGVVNLTIRPILTVLTFPISLLTLGLFSFVINGFLLWFIASFVDGFSVSGFWVAVLGAFVISIFKSLGEKLITDD